MMKEYITVFDAVDNYTTAFWNWSKANFMMAIVFLIIGCVLLYFFINNYINHKNTRSMRVLTIAFSILFLYFSVKCVQSSINYKNNAEKVIEMCNNQEYSTLEGIALFNNDYAGGKSYEIGNETVYIPTDNNIGYSVHSCKSEAAFTNGEYYKVSYLFFDSGNGIQGKLIVKVEILNKSE